MKSNGQYSNNGRSTLSGNGNMVPGARQADESKRQVALGAEGVDEASAASDKVNRILLERARALAKNTVTETSETRQVVVFSLANESYAIATDYVHEVQAMVNLSPVPCTPSLVVGVINIRGAIYSVIDIREFFGLPKREITDATKVILVNAAGLEVGILADDVKGAMNIPVTSLQSSLASHAGGKEEFVEGVTRDMLIVLNIEALLSDERIIINEEVM